MHKAVLCPAKLVAEGRASLAPSCLGKWVRPGRSMPGTLPKGSQEAEIVLINL